MTALAALSSSSIATSDVMSQRLRVEEADVSQFTAQQEGRVEVREY
jgi:hypothetical protein